MKNTTSNTTSKVSSRRVKTYTNQNTNLYNIKDEIWKDIEGYNGDYKVSNMGRIKSLKQSSPRIIRQSYKGDYLGVTLSNGSPKDYHVHKLVAITFLNHKPDGYKLVCDHKNYNKLDNRLSNIQLISHKENINRSLDNKKNN